MMPTRRVIDPAGVLRRSFPRGTGFEGALRAAWNLADVDGFVMGHCDTRWTLHIHRPLSNRSAALLQITQVEDRALGGNDRRRARCALVEAAWQELTDEGWRVQLESNLHLRSS